MPYDRQPCRTCRNSGVVRLVSGRVESCIPCAGTGRALTPAARKLRAARQAKASALLTIPAATVTVGMAIRGSNDAPFRVVTAISVARTGTLTFTLDGDAIMVGATATVQRAPNAAERAAIMAVAA